MWSTFSYFTSRCWFTTSCTSPKWKKQLKKKAEELTKKVKEVNLEELKDELIDDFNNLKEELKDMDLDKAKIIAKDKGEDLMAKASELMDMAKEKGTPVVEKAAKDIKKKVAEVLKELSVKLDD